MRDYAGAASGTTMGLLVSNGVAMLANGPDTPDGDEGDGGDISGAPFEAMKDIRLTSYAACAG